MTSGYPSPAAIKRRRRVALTGLAVLAALGGGFAVAQAGGDAAEVTPAGKRIEAAIHRFNRAEERRVEAAVSTKAVLGIPRSRLDAIAECESHGDPAAVSSDGLYRGKYQFHRGTWASVGGDGDPIRASEPEQDKRAALLIKRSGGASPWPICG
jgi:hypothetical protein